MARSDLELHEMLLRDLAGTGDAQYDPQEGRISLRGFMHQRPPVLRLHLTPEQLGRAVRRLAPDYGEAFRCSTRRSPPCWCCGWTSSWLSRTQVLTHGTSSCGHPTPRRGKAVRRRVRAVSVVRLDGVARGSMVGRRFGPYELEELLGRGGMGEVWRAVDTRKQRTVALKLLPSELGGHRDVEERFRREAQVAARLSDPHVIPIHDYGEVHGRLYLDMRLVHGVDLAKTLRAGGALPPARAVAILEQVADALDAAHDDGLVHRDVKPSNILITTSRGGSDDFVYLIDFGIAAGSVLGTRLTATGHAVGTAAYMAPERFTEDREADGRVDVYALGCVLHEMLTGSAPFEGTSFPNLMYQHLHAPPPRPSASIELRPGFDAVVATALAKDPARRYRRAGDLAEAARSVLVAPRPTRVGPPSAPHGGPPPGPGAPPPTRQGPAPGPRWDLAPPSPAPPPPTPSPARGRSAWLVTGAVAAIVAIIVWSTITVFGTVATFAQCANSPLGCVGGAVGLASVAAAVIGVVAAAGALRRGRGVGRAWICVAATVVLTLVMAGFGAASS